VTALAQWEVVRHRVTVAGRVVDVRRRPIAGILVRLSGPKRLESRVASAKRDAVPKSVGVRQRIDRSETRWDGIYFFLDLLPGEYRVRAGDSASGGQADTTVAVPAQSDEQTAMVVADLAVAGA